MSTATDIAPVVSKGDFNEDDTDHIYCDCNPDVALCGEDVSASPDLTEAVGREYYLCVVCEDLEANYCKRCGF